MRRAWAGLRRLGTPGVAGVVLLAVIVLACLIGPLLSPYGVNEQDLTARYQGPSWAHPFGTGALGEDMLTRVLVAGRISLLIGLATALVATVAGAGMGLAAGGRGGWLDSALARLTDLVLIVPGFVILIVLSISLESVGPGEIILILALLSWPPLFRLTRASALRTRELPYVQAARAAGAGGWRIARRHLLPRRDAGDRLLRGARRRASRSSPRAPSRSCRWVSTPTPTPRGAR